MTTQKHTQPRDGESRLSVELTQILDESTRLLRLKTEFGRMPSGPVRSFALSSIEQWFQKPRTPMETGAKDLVEIEFRALQELWTAYRSVTEEIIREGVSFRVIRRLESETYVCDSVEEEIPF